MKKKSDIFFYTVGILLGVMMIGVGIYRIFWIALPILNNYENFEKDYLKVTSVEWHREDSEVESGARYEYVIHGYQESNGREVYSFYKSIESGGRDVPVPQVGKRLPIWSSDIIPDNQIIMRYSEDFPVKPFQMKLIYAIVLLPISFGVTVYVIRGFMLKLNWL